jgi:Glycosyltransferase family 87
VIGLLVFARRIFGAGRGGRIGIVLAFAWLAYPYTAFALQSNSNDSLIAALVIWGLALFSKPVWRGATLALATAAKFAPLVLAPLFAAGEPGLSPRDLRRTGVFAAAFGAVTALMLLGPLLDPGLATFWDRTLSSQLDRSSPFSIWGQVDGVEWLQTGTLGLAALLAIAIAFVPRRRSVVDVAALAAAALIGLQLAVDHWFYLYIPWFAGPALIALAATGLGYYPAGTTTREGGMAMETPDEAVIDDPELDEAEEIPDEELLPDEQLDPGEGDDTADEQMSGGDTAETPVSP